MLQRLLRDMLVLPHPSIQWKNLEACHFHGAASEGEWFCCVEASLVMILGLENLPLECQNTLKCPISFAYLDGKPMEMEFFTCHKLMPFICALVQAMNMDKDLWRINTKPWSFHIKSVFQSFMFHANYSCWPLQRVLLSCFHCHDWEKENCLARLHIGRLPPLHFHLFDIVFVTLLRWIQINWVTSNSKVWKKICVQGELPLTILKHIKTAGWWPTKSRMVLCLQLQHRKLETFPFPPKGVGHWDVDKWQLLCNLIIL